MSRAIQHTGVVSGIEAEKLHVRITQPSACGGCHAKGVCKAVGDNEREVVVENFTGHYRIGDTVELEGKTSDGLLAVLLAFILPFVVVLLALFILAGVVENEIAVALLSLLILVPYYLIISFFNQRIGRKIRFFVKKTDNS